MLENNYELVDYLPAAGKAKNRHKGAKAQRHKVTQDLSCETYIVQSN